MLLKWVWVAKDSSKFIKPMRVPEEKSIFGRLSCMGVQTQINMGMMKNRPILRLTTSSCLFYI
jgi:hypothetical protein